MKVSTALALCLTVAATACTTAVPPPPLPKEPWVAVLNARGQRIGGLAVATERYLQGMGPRMGGNLGADARDRQGRTINEWGLYGWVDGNRVQVVLLTQVVIPASDSSPRGSGDRPTVRWEEFARYPLVTGETREIAEAKALGLDTMSVRVDGK